APGVRPAKKPMTLNARAVSRGYFAVMDVPLVRGRDFAATDSGAERTPIIIGDDFAHQVWGETDPIGRRLDLVDRNPARPVFMPAPPARATASTPRPCGGPESPRASTCGPPDQRWTPSRCSSTRRASRCREPR